MEEIRLLTPEEIQRSESAKTLGRLGGNSTLKKYGKDHYKKMIEKRWNKKKEAKNETDLV